ncbi:YigZ family protein [Nocardioides sp. R-C-SC26]|uniref:YigZ family protein n=1 Tax=Nocardioides sp. R-C-SC26 TaxID=2870414 RepID=UPI001E34590A|nr:YigZ family protein [Nocardioides sp. R-C-SC26]
MSASRYLVPARDAEAEIEVKRSRFLATLKRVTAEDDARALVARLRKEHGDARHHCSAFVIGPPPRSVERSHDDGEPAGTAGAPMLEVLRGAEVSDVVVVVTRWFGGTLLGAGGLVRAYGDAVRSALAEAGTTPRERLREFEVALDHGVAGRVESELRQRGIAVLGAGYGTHTVLRLAISPSAEAALHATIAELTAGASAASCVGERWVET